MATVEESRFGERAPRYSFIMNPYPDFRGAKCPECNRPNGQRKLPLLIHVAPARLVALNYTCRYCRRCDLLLAHKHEIEHLLRDLFSQLDPKAIGEEYLVLGTVEKEAWRQGLEQPKPAAQILPHAHDFKRYCSELRMTQRGWLRRDQEPPVARPPASREWVKAKLLG